MSPKNIVFFDGTCGLCNTVVNFLIKRDLKSLLYFAPLQGKTARKLLKPADFENLDSLVLWSEGRSYSKTNAIIQIGWTLGGVWSLQAAFLWLIPTPLRDVVYDLIARNRHGIFGNENACDLPPSGERPRFLD